jgi:mannose-1-phosphate guanylyltransferase / mannose-6-phosphate isomerase
VIYPVILSGGSGTRLWPMSRSLYPKQLLALTGERSLLQETALRVAGDRAFAPPLIVANEEHRFIIAEQLREIGVTQEALILEPFGRNTAPAACVAALRLIATQAPGDPEKLMLVMPSDHAIGDLAAFRQAIERAAAAARAGHLVTFGITPDRAETGYGYIASGQPLDIVAGAVTGAFAVTGFVEKPDPETAERYVASGEYFWNSGIFLFPASLYLSELERLRPDMLAACKAAFAGARSETDFVRLDKTAFGACPSDSIDYAVMEHTHAAAVVPVSMRWSDLGSWDALWEMGQKDERGNALSGNVVAEATRNCYLRSEAGLVAAIGVEDIVVVATDDAVMIAPRSRTQEVKQLVGRLLAEKRDEADALPTVHRPWGSYRSLHNGHRVQVKHILVRPGGKLSLQMHHHRAEHWVVVQGTARIVRGNEETILTEDQSTYIPLGTPHRLENPGKIPLHVIEVQSGSYLGEDDIVRFEDHYGRQ